MHRVVLLAMAMVFVVDSGSCVQGQSPAQGAPGRRALLVGCTEYRSLDKVLWLSGPANDVALMRQTLVKDFQFPDQAITTLVEGRDNDHRPTRANIQREFDRLAATATPNEQIVILLGGHGTQVPDRPPYDEPDGLDEAFLPADIGPWDRNRQDVANAIVDDELNQWLQAICNKGARVWLIADSCHSGTLIRGRGEEKERKIAPEALGIPAEARKAAEERTRSARARVGNPQGRRAEPPQGDLADDANRLPGLVALYASQPNEPTIEDQLPVPNSPYHGLLTYTLVQTLKQARTPLTYRQLTRRIYASHISSGRYSPTPMLDGRDEDRDRYVLGEDRAPSPARYQLKRDARGNWTIDAGALHGLTVGSILSVAADDDAKENQFVGHVRVTKQGFRPLTSMVEPCQADGTAAQLDLPSPGRCRVVFVNYGDMIVRVAVDRVVGAEVSAEEKAVEELDASGRARLSALLQELAASRNNSEQLIVSEDDPARAEWLVRATTPAAKAVVIVPAAGWAKQRGTALPATLGPMPVAGTALKEQLARIAKAQNLLKIAASQMEALRDASGGGINLKVEMVRLADSEDRQGEVVAMEPGLTLQVGDLVGFRVENVGNVTADLTLLWVDGNSKITAAFPDPDQPGVDNRIEPTARGGKPLLRRFQITEDGLGREHLVVIAVQPRGPERADFSSLAERTFADVQRTMKTRGVGENSLDSPLGKLLQSAMFARGLSRGARPIEARTYSIQDLSWQSRPRQAAGGK